tara:strand:+ start:1088 stop:1633 length:546 start_codon:yes stop_codon:yes gene_type:complete
MNNIVNQLYNYQNSNQKINNTNNGRIDISGNYQKNSYIPMYPSNNNLKSVNNQYIKHSYDETIEQKYFFSKENIENLQKLLKYHVWVQSGKKHIIGNQDIDQLLVIMKSIYLQYGTNYAPDAIKQVKRLNAFVLDYSVPNILSNIEMNSTYKKSVSNLPKPMELPKYISSAGTRTNPNIIY